MSLLERLKLRLGEYFLGNVEVYSEDNVHFRVVIKDSKFNGMTKIAQHRKVYEVLGDMMSECHAVQIETKELL